MENMQFPYWDSCVRIIGEDKAKRMIKKEEHDYLEMMEKEKKRYVNR
jgi:hypothetical protein